MMCHFTTSWDTKETQIKNIDTHLALLKELEEDGLVQIEKTSLSIPEKARPFIRNICMAFDVHLLAKKTTTKLFSQTI